MEFLEEEFTIEEVECVLNQLGGNTSLGKDGISNYFIKAYWSIIKINFWKAISHFLCYGELNKEWKETLIVLKPKVSNPILPSNYRPISLCNIVYKVGARVILNRLIVVIPKLISKEQAVFIKGRSLSDHVLVAQEIFHKLRFSKAAKGLVSFKVDMEQAYDSMSWSSLRKVLEYFDILTKISKLIMECVEDPTFSLIINDDVITWSETKRKVVKGVKNILKTSVNRQANIVLRRLTTDDFQFIIDRALRKLNLWGSKILSLA
ncbi:uncharacterized protein LOC110096618, partial [Dendrobium catenatum]|uniref:uncharacterized protein LOC110096618 n=1 Tax=Dendrobium catenatum TaxID=906689 RepID=UPI0009F268B9